MKTVCVIIPCYKDSATIRAALDSVQAQTHPVDEIIVINDCSPESDQIDAIMADFSDVVYIVNPTNMGLSATRNVGIFRATADILTFLDADDQLHPQKIAAQLSVYAPKTAISCQVVRTAETLDLTLLGRFPSVSRTKTHRHSYKMLYKNYLVGASMMIDRQTLISAGGYDENLRSCEDYDLWLRLMDAGVTVKEILQPLYLYRTNLQGLSCNSVAISYWELRAIEAHLLRSGQKFLLSFQDALIWAVWQFRHLFRYEVNPDPVYKQTIRQNIQRLDNHPVLRAILIVVDRGRFMKMPVWIMRLLRRI